MVCMWFVCGNFDVFPNIYSKKFSTFKLYMYSRNLNMDTKRFLHLTRIKEI